MQNRSWMRCLLPLAIGLEGISLPGAFVVTTRPEEKNSPVSCGGLDVINYPVTELVRLPVDWDAIRNFHPDVLIFTSEYSASIACPLVKKFSNAEIISIGNATAKALLKCGIRSQVPEVRASAGVVSLIKQRSWGGKRFALFSSAKSNMIIRDFLISGGYDFRFFPIYDAIAKDLSGLPGLLAREGCLGIVFTSSQEAEIVLGNSYIAKLLKTRGLKTYAIGTVTARTMEAFGFTATEPRGNSDLKELICRIAENNA